MSRPLRILGAGLIYHAMARGNNRMEIFLDDLDRARFLEILADAVRRSAVDLWVLCLMGNHYHLVLRTREPNLSAVIQQVNGSYAQWWNKRHARTGHILQGRFKAQIVEASVYLVRLCRYVLLNPVRAGLCTHPGQWRWNSYRMLTGATLVDWVDVGSLLKCIDGDDLEGIRARLIDFVEPEADPDMASFIRSDRRVIGTPAFARQFQRIARVASPDVPARDRRAGTSSLADLLADAVTRGEGLPGGIRRALTEGDYPLAEIARCAGVSRVTVERIMARGSGVPTRADQPSRT